MALLISLSHGKNDCGKFRTFGEKIAGNEKFA